MTLRRIWIPLVNPTPIKTLPKRLIRKCLQIAQQFIFSIGLSLGFLGAKKVGGTPTGNALLKLNKDYALGSKGTVVELPEDRVIFDSVKRKGSYALEESIFLARGLKRACQQPNTKTALLDIGANTGLVTLQAMNLSKTTNDVFLFEPVPKHASAIKQNLKGQRNIHVNEFALGDKNGSAEIFTEAANHGNTSLLDSVVPKQGMISTQIQLVETAAYCQEFLSNFDSYVIKCDTQGMDALILSRIPERIWKNCESAIIEVWSISEINKRDVEALLSMCKEFRYISWHPNAGKEIEIELSEVSEVWLNKSGSIRNLFLSKNI